MRDKLLAAQTEGPRLQGGLDAAPRVIEGLFDFATTDIDIALDDQLGTEFANRVSRSSSQARAFVSPASHQRPTPRPR